MARRIDFAKTNILLEESKDHKPILIERKDYVETYPTEVSKNASNLPLLTADLYQLWSLTKLPRVAKRTITHKELIGAEATTDPVLGEVKLAPVFQERQERCYDYFFSAEMATALSFEDAIREKHFRGLANFLMVSLLIEQTNANIHRMRFIPKKGFIHWNYAHAFYSLQKGKYTHPDIQLDITSQAIANPLLPGDYVTPYDWLYTHWDERSGKYTPAITPDLAAIANHPAFLHEKHITLAIILLTPLAVLNKIFFAHRGTSEAEHHFNTACGKITIGRKIAMERKALLDRRFRQFLFHEAMSSPDSEKNEIALFILALEHSTPGIGRELDEKCRHLSTPERLLSYILHDPDVFQTDEEKQELIAELVSDAVDHNMIRVHTLEAFILSDSRIAIEFKKSMIKKIVLSQIANATSVEAVLAIKRKLESPAYNTIKERTGCVTWSLWGYTHEGKSVSQTFSDLMGKIKERMVTLATPEDKDALAEQRQFLLDHRMRSLWSDTATTKPLRDFESKFKDNKKDDDEHFEEVDLEPDPSWAYTPP